MFLKRQSTRLISRHSLLWKAVKHCIWTWTLHLRTPLGQLQKAHLHIFQYYLQIERSGHFGCLRYPFFPLSCCHRTFVPLGFWQTYHKKQSRFVQHGEESQGNQYQLQVFPDISYEFQRDDWRQKVSNGNHHFFDLIPGQLHEKTWSVMSVVLIEGLYSSTIAGARISTFFSLCRTYSHSLLD